MSSDSVCPTFRKVFIASVFGVCVFLIPSGVQSATSNSRTIQWKANQETDLAGYRVYHGTTSGIYGSPQTTGKTASYQYTGLESNKTHYFSITAFDHSGNESNPSPEVNTFIQAAVPPTLTSPIPNTTLEGATTTFTWTPNETAVSEYWLEIGSAVNTDDLYDSGSIAASVLSRSISGLPTDARPVFVRFWWLVNGTWEVSRVEFAAAGGSISSFPLTISKSGDGSGTITSNPIGLSCGSTCTASFSTESPVTLSANAASDSIFSGWSGGGCSGTGSCVVALSFSTSVSANFALIPPVSHSLGVSLTGDGSGTVSSSPTGLSCSTGTCSSTFPQDSSVTLTAAPSSGSTFSGWGGACTGTSSCVVALSTSSASVSATFASSPPPSNALNVTLAGGGSGIVSSSPASSTVAIVNPARLTQEEIKRQKKLAKAEKKEQKKLAKAEKKEQKKLAKAEKKEQKKLAKAEKLLAKIQKALAKIETKLVRYADNPKVVARLNKKKEKYSMVLAKFQEKYSFN